MAEPSTVVGSPHFKLILQVVVGMTLLCFATYLVLAFFGNGSEAQDSLQATCDFGFKAGFGAILGLLGGKVA